MALFQLYGGRIILPTIGKQNASVDESDSLDSQYAWFPFCVPSMKKLEECIEKKHVISFLSGQGLAQTEQELSYIC